MEHKPNYKKLASFFYEIGTLRKIPRSHRQTLLTSDVSDNISSHLFRVTWIGYFLAKLAKADPNKTVMMCLLHDITEARSGDQNWVHKKYIKVFDKEIINDQLSGIPAENELKTISTEYERRQSLESKLAKDADLIEQILLLTEHAYGGNKEAESWLEGKKFTKKCQQYCLLSNELSKKLARELIKQKPSDWWTAAWTSYRR